MDLGWVGMTQVGSEEVRTSRWTPRKWEYTGDIREYFNESKMV